MIKVDNPQPVVARPAPAGQPTAAAARADTRGAGADRYTPSAADAAEPVAYSGKPAGAQARPAMFEPLRDFVASLLRQQGIDTEGTAASPEEAAVAIADDGYWGVEQTSERIYQFAIGAVGDDLSRLEKVREAIMQGFEEAKEMLGGWLPEISQQTIERVGEKLDAWEQQRREEVAAAE